MISSLLEEIKTDGINVATFSRYKRDKDEHKKGDLKEVYICSMTGSEITLDEQFLNQYDVIEEWLDSIKYSSSGYVYKVTTYKVIEKSSGKVVYEK